jgi:hypothetical protein
MSLADDYLVDPLPDAIEDWCPCCKSAPLATHIGTLGYREHFQCRDCGYEWSWLNRAKAQASYEDACDCIRAQQKEER